MNDETQAVVAAVSEYIPRVGDWVHHPEIYYDDEGMTPVRLLVTRVAPQTDDHPPLAYVFNPQEDDDPADCDLTSEDPWEWGWECEQDRLSLAPSVDLHEARSRRDAMEEELEHRKLIVEHLEGEGACSQWLAAESGGEAEHA